MREFFKRNRGVITLLFIIFMLYIVFFALGISCPVKHIFGVSCPGCGMTRATLSALRLDFTMAFYYHPLWPIVLPSVVLLVFLFKKGKRGIFKAAIALFVLAFLFTYFIRLFATPDNAIVTFSPEGGGIKRAIDFVFNFD